MKTSIITLLTLSLLSFQSSSFELSVDTGISTSHLFDDYEYNEDNHLVAVELEINDIHINVSSFINSYNNPTYSLGSKYSMFDSKYIELSVLYGFMQGYTSEQIGVCTHNNYCVFAAPSVEFKYPVTEKLDISTTSLLLGNALVITTGVTYKF